VLRVYLKARHALHRARALGTLGEGNLLRADLDEAELLLGIAALPCHLIESPVARLKPRSRSKK